MNAMLHPISRRSFLAGAAATSALVVLHPFSARAQANQAHLRIMETTDLHVHVYPYDYYADKPNDPMGLARTASIIDQIRAEGVPAVFGSEGVAEGAAPGTLIIDSSSIDPEATRALAAEAAERGLRWVDSPLSGGIPKVAIGQLTLMQAAE